MVDSQIEVEEENLRKLRDGIDQMNIEDGVEGNDEVQESRTKKAKAQSKITTKSRTLKKCSPKAIEHILIFGRFLDIWVTSDCDETYIFGFIMKFCTR